MDTNLNSGGLTPSDMALRDSLNLRPGTLLEPMMLTPSQQELLRQDAKEIVALLEQSPRLKVLLKKLRS
jgi:hypothetical protein